MQSMNTQSNLSETETDSTPAFPTSFRNSTSFILLLLLLKKTFTELLQSFFIVNMMVPFQDYEC